MRQKSNIKVCSITMAVVQTIKINVHVHRLFVISMITYSQSQLIQKQPKGLPFYKFVSMTIPVSLSQCPDCCQTSNRLGEVGIDWRQCNACDALDLTWSPAVITLHRDGNHIGIDKQSVILWCWHSVIMATYQYTIYKKVKVVFI